MQKEISLTLGLADLVFSYLLFTNQQYFSLIAMLALFLLVLITFVMLVLPCAIGAGARKEDGRRHERSLALLNAVAIPLSAAIIVYSFLFSRVAPGYLSPIADRILLAIFAAALSAALVYALVSHVRTLKERKWKWAAVAAGAVAITALAYFIMYYNVQYWPVTDEVAFNYYAAAGFLNGSNPYTTSMQPILDQYHITGTVTLDGVYKYDYNYPPLSFLSYLFVPAIHLSPFFVPITIFTIFLGVLSSAIAFYYYRSSRLATVPLGIWLFTTYILIEAANFYLAVSLFLLLAYILRANGKASGVLLGLAASTIQSAWFAVPFFLILAYREHGKKCLVDTLALSSLTFAAVLAYFVLISPAATIGGIFGFFRTKFLFFGTSIMQLFARFLPMPYWYTKFLTASFLLLCMAVFYLQPDGKRPLLAVAPAMVYFLSWGNMPRYGLAFFPLILTIYAQQGRQKDTYRSKAERRLPSLLLAGFLALAVFVGAYAHLSYASADIISISRVIPAIAPSNASYGGYALAGLDVGVANNGNTPEPVSFAIVSRSPSNFAYMIGATGGRSLQPQASSDYFIPFSLPLVNNNTRVFIIAFSPDYTATYSLSPVSSR